MIKIIDVSKNNGVINWQAVKESGVIGAFIRAVDDDGFSPDPMFAQNWRLAKEAGLSRGFYSIFYGWLDPVETAKNAVKIVRERSDGDLWMGEWRPALDVEPVNQYQPASVLAQKVKLQLEMLERETFKQPIIYTSANCWQFINPSSDAMWASQYALWLAHYVYGVGKNGEGRRSKTWDDFQPDFQVSKPPAWKTYALWQWVGDAGMNDGVPTACDLNVINGAIDGVNIDEILGSRQSVVELPFDSREMDEGIHELDPLNRFANYLKEKLTPRKTITNQDVINAFYRVHGADRYWQELENVASWVGFSINEMVFNRGAEFKFFDNLPDIIKDALK